MSEYAKTYQQIINGSLRLLRDYRGNGYDGRYYRVTEVFNKVKDVLYEMVMKTGILKSIRSIQIRKGYYIYNLPDDCIRLLRASVNGLDGEVITPRQRGVSDYGNDYLPGTSGNPLYFFRETLNFNQIGFVPGPVLDGSTFSRDSLFGLLRQITEDSNFDSAVYVFARDSAIGLIREITDNGGLTVSYTPDETALRALAGDDMRFYRDNGGIIRDILSRDPSYRLPYDAETGLRDISGEIPFVRDGDGNIIRSVLSPYGNIQVTYVREPYFSDSTDDYPDSKIPEYIHKDVKYGVAYEFLKGENTERATFFFQKWNATVFNLQRFSEHKGQLDSVRPM